MADSHQALHDSHSDKQSCLSGLGNSMEHSQHRPGAGKKEGAKKNADNLNTYVEDIDTLFREFSDDETVEDSPQAPLHTKLTADLTADRTPLIKKKAKREKESLLWKVLGYFNIIELFCSFVRPGGVKSTIFNLLNATAGPAIIAMPEAFRASGLLFASFQLLVACLVNYVSSSCLLYTSFEWKSFSFSQLSQHCANKAHTKFVDLTFFVCCIFTTFSFTVLVQGNLTSCFSFIRAKFWTDMPPILDDSKSSLWVFVFGIALFPLIMKRQLKSLTIYSFLGFLTLGFILIITIIGAFDPAKGSYYRDYGELRLVNWSGVTYTMPIFIFSFMTQFNLLQCYEELEKPSLRRMHKVLAKQHFICFSIYLLIGIFGYLSFPKEDSSFAFYLQRYDPVANTDILVAITLLVLVTFVGQPFNFLPARENFQYLILGTEHKPTKTWAHVLITLFLHGIAVGGAYYSVSVGLNTDKLLNITGTLTCTLISYIFPFKFFLRTFTKSHTSRGKRYLWFVRGLYYFFWIFQIATVAALFWQIA